MKFLGKFSKALLLCAAVLSLASCGDEKKEETTTSSAIPSTIKVGVVPELLYPTLHCRDLVVAERRDVGNVHQGLVHRFKRVKRWR